MGLEPALRASSAMLLIYVLAGEECFIFKLAYEFVKLDCIFPAGVGSRHQEGVCHHSSMDSAAGQMAVCIPMVMLGYFQPNPNPNPNPNGLTARWRGVVDGNKNYHHT
jgi:hypothetical protein